MLDIKAEMKGEKIYVERKYAFFMVMILTMLYYIESS